MENICELHSARLAVSTHYLGSCKFCASQWWLWITHFSLMGSYLTVAVKPYISLFSEQGIFLTMYEKQSLSYYNEGWLRYRLYLSTFCPILLSLISESR